MNWRSQFDEIELIKMYFQRAKLPGEKVLIDVGAHVGWVSMAFLDLGWKVIAFEPEPDNLKDLIQRSESYSKQIQIVQKAV
ncbi:MAG: FkbM family methyltransferase, partial [Bacteriovoracaceae bacterium]|nr:FkbM family methyltransferase [Bacteriovoracaceae bacterium]